MPNINNEENEKMVERRKYVRIQKNFILAYFDPKNPDDAEEITQLKNISMGGLCFVTSKRLEPGTTLGIEISTPYVSGKTYVEGKVLQSHEKVKGILYETRFQYNDLSTEAKVVLDKLINYFISGDNHENE